MATGTSNDTELEELKEMVRQMGNRTDILSAANTDLSSKMQKAKETFDAQTADLNARLLKSFERIQEQVQLHDGHLQESFGDWS